MSLTCQFEQLAGSYSLGDLTKEVVIDAKLKLPETAPKVDAVIGGSYQAGEPVITVNENFLVVSGVVYPQLIYVTDEVNELSGHHHEHQDHNGDENKDEYDIPREPREQSYTWLDDNGIIYEERVDIPGLQASAVVEVKIVPTACDFEKSGTDRLIFTAKLLLVIQPTNMRQNTIISDLPVQPGDKITTTKMQITTEELSCVKRAVIPVQSSLLLPSLKPGASRILTCGVFPSSLSWEYNRGKIYLKGLLDINVVYIGRDDDDLPAGVMVNEWTRETGNAIPFETSFETNIPEDGILVVPNVAPVDTRLQIKSHREMHCRINLQCEATISRIRTHEIVTEAAPGPGTIIDSQKGLLNVEEFQGEANGEIPFELSVDLPAGQPGAERLLHCQGLLLHPKTEIADGNVAIEANIDLGLFYMAEGSDGPRLCAARWESRYNNSLPVAGMVEFPNLPPGSILRVQTTIESLKPQTVNERTIKITGLVKIRILARNPRTVSILDDCAEVVPVNPETRPSMMFYIVQPGDTLWKIARRYSSTVAQLLQNNQISNPDRIEPGQKLLIPKQAAG